MVYGDSEKTLKTVYKLTSVLLVVFWTLFAFAFVAEYFSKKVITKLEGYIGVIASSISLSQSNLEEKITQKDALIAEKTKELQLKENEIQNPRFGYK